MRAELVLMGMRVDTSREGRRHKPVEEFEFKAEDSE